MARAQHLIATLLSSSLAPLVVLLVACGKHPPDYFPLDENRYWHYSIERTTMDGTVTQKYFLRSAAARKWQGVDVAVKRTVNGHEYFYHVDGEQVQRIAYKLRDGEIQSEAHIVTLLPALRRVGQRWTQLSTTAVLENTGPPWETLFRIEEPITLQYEIESMSESVRVPAGEFHNCFKITGRGKTNVEVGNYIGRAEITVEVTDWYAPDVGLVRTQRVERTDAAALNYGSVDMKLESFSNAKR